MPKSQEKNVFYHFKMVSIRNEKIQEWFVQVEVGSIEYYISFEYSVQKNVEYDQLFSGDSSVKVGRQKKIKQTKIALKFLRVIK